MKGLSWGMRLKGLIQIVWGIRLNGLIKICRVMLGYQVKLFDPEILGYCGVIRLNGLIQMCRVMLGYQICLLMFSTRF